MTAQEARRRLEERFPGRELISKAEAADALGISKRTLLKRYELPPGSLVSMRAILRAVAREAGR